MAEAQTIDPYGKLLSDVLADLSAATRQAYEKDLKDFSQEYIKLPKGQEAGAVRQLLAGGFETANALVRDYRADMDTRRELSSSTINRRLSTLRKLVQAAHRRSIVSWSIDVPNIKDEPVHNADGPDLDDMRRIVFHVAKDESAKGRRGYAIIRLMADLGLRRGAVINMDLNDLDLPKRIRVRLKGREKKRWKDLPPETSAALRRWLAVHPTRSKSRVGPVFVNLVPGWNARISGSAIYEIVTEFSEAAGCRTRPHGIRHSAITNAIVNAARLGETLDSVMQFSDHADFRMVLRYRNASKKAQKKFANANAATFGDPLAR